jgi:hypothetical protein
MEPKNSQNLKQEIQTIITDRLGHDEPYLKPLWSMIDDYAVAFARECLENMQEALNKADGLDPKLVIQAMHNAINRLSGESESP